MSMQWSGKGEGVDGCSTQAFRRGGRLALLLSVVGATACGKTEPAGALPSARANANAQPADVGSLADGGDGPAPRLDSGILQIPGPIAVPGQAPYDTWTFIPVAGSFCGDGKPTGIMVNPHAGNENLLVFFEPGGACWDYDMCIKDGVLSYVPTDGGSGDLSLTTNDLFRRDGGPFQDDNFLVIPYCTGDVYTGRNTYTYNSDGGSLTVHHVGYLDVVQDLKPVVATIPNPNRVVIAGSSAGGYGALFNYGQVHAAFPNSPAFLIDDCGPPLRPPYGAPAWYAQQALVWGLDQNIPAGCPQCNSADGGGLYNLFSYYAQDPSFRGSLLETMRDTTISAFYSDSPGNPEIVCYPDGGGPCEFPEALEDLYESSIVHDGPGQMHVYGVNNDFHIFLMGRYDDPGTPPVSTFVLQQLGDPDAGPWVDVLP